MRNILIFIGLIITFTINGQLKNTNPRLMLNAINYNSTGIYNVLDYGADHTGATNSTSSIQATIDAAKDGIVFIPEGEYDVDSLCIKYATIIQGAGYSVRNNKGTVLKTTSALPVFIFRNKDAVSIYSDGASIRDLCIYGDSHADNGSFKQTGMMIITEAPTIIDRVWFYNLGDYGIRLGDSTHTTKTKIQDSHFLLNERGGIYGRSLDNQINAIRIENCELNENYQS